VINTTGWAVPTTELDIPFHDISSDFWYARYTSLALSKGMIQRSMRFRPNDPITRAEASKILTVALGVTVSEVNNITYADVSRTMTLAKYVEAVTFLNIFSGQMSNGQRIFRPNDPITRAEIAKVVVNAFGL
jgi:N-acetylmuramoyl-L-alanine amidase